MELQVENIHLPEGKVVRISTVVLVLVIKKSYRDGIFSYGMELPAIKNAGLDALSWTNTPGIEFRYVYYQTCESFPILDLQQQDNDIARICGGGLDDDGPTENADVVLLLAGQMRITHRHQ